MGEAAERQDLYLKEQGADAYLPGVQHPMPFEGIRWLVLVRPMVLYL